MCGNFQNGETHLDEGLLVFSVSLDLRPQGGILQQPRILGHLPLQQQPANRLWNAWKWRQFFGLSMAHPLRPISPPHYSKKCRRGINLPLSAQFIVSTLFLRHMVSPPKGLAADPQYVGDNAAEISQGLA